MGELSFLKFLESIRTDFFNSFFESITMLGEETILVLVIATIYFIFDKHLAQRILFITLSSLCTNCTLKNIIRRPRPFFGGKVSCVRPKTATGYSFPSGHTQNFTTWSLSLSVYSGKKLLIFFVSVLCLLLGFSRLFLGAHYPSDVLAGLILGAFFALLGNKLYDKVKNKNLLNIAFLIIMTPFAVYFLCNPEPLFKDFFKSYGMLFGYCIAVYVEGKFAPIKYNISLVKKIFRTVIAVTLALLIKEGLGVIQFSSIQHSLIFNSVKYFILVFSVFGLFPFILKKLNM